MPSGLPRSDRGRVFDLPLYVARLMRASDEHAFLIVNVAATGDFLQMSGDARGVQLDFPMIAPRQQSFEASIRAEAARAGLAVVENYGSDGARFLDISVNGEAHAVAAVCSRVLRAVFNVSGDAELIFQHAGLAPERAT